MQWLIHNAGTILIAAAVCALVAWIIVKMVRDKKNGNSCSCGCADCALKNRCHK